MLHAISSHMDERFVGYLAIVLFLPIAVAVGRAWIWLLGTLKPRLLPGIRWSCSVGYWFFPVFLFVVMLARYIVWRLGVTQLREGEDIVVVFLAPLWVFLFYYALDRFTLRQIRRKEERGELQLPKEDVDGWSGKDRR